MICLPSLAAILDGGAEKIKSDLKPAQPLKSSE
jgi:hypothetical protein